MLTKITPAFILVCTLTTSIRAEGQLNSNTFHKKIHVPAKEVRVDSLLRIFSKQTGVEFSFNSNKISPSKKLAVAQHTQTLSQWLATLNNTLGVQHKVVGNHIILIDIDKPVAKKKVTIVSTNQGTNREVVLPPVAKKQSGQETKIETVGNNSEKENRNEISSVETTQRKSIQSPKPIGVTPIVVKHDSIVILKNQAATPISVTAVTTTPSAPSEVPKVESIQFIGGYSKHGSGDMKGVVFSGEYTRYLSKKFSLTYNFRGTINSSKHEIRVDNGGNITDASVRFTTAGVQLGVNGGLSLINSAKHEVMIKLGAFGRYQSASNGSDGYSLYYPSTTGVPTVLVGYDNRTPQETIAFGGILQFQYNFTFNNNLFLGIQPAFQTDTNGDAILQVGVVVGKRL